MRKMLLGVAAIVALAAHHTDAIADVSWNHCPITPEGRQCIQEPHVMVKADPLTVNSGKDKIKYNHWVVAKYICNLDINITAKTVETISHGTTVKTKDGVYNSSILDYNYDSKEKTVVLTCDTGTPQQLPLADKATLAKIGWVSSEAAPAPANLPKFDLDVLEHGCGPDPWIGNEYDLFRQNAKTMNIGKASLQALQMTAADLSKNVASDETKQQKRLDQSLLCVIKARMKQLESSPPKATDLNRKALLQSLPRRGDGDGTALLKESVALAAEDPATKAARAREKGEQRRRDEAVLRQASSDYIQGVVTATASQIEQAQQTSGSTGSSATQGAASPSDGDCGTTIAHACK